MRNYILALALLLSGTVFAQKTEDYNATPTSEATTTVEEYNYMLKGYKMQVDGGLDMKKGYFIRDVFTIRKGNGKYTFNFKELYRENDSSFVGTIVVGRSTVSGNTYYYAIPGGRSDLSEQFEKSVSTLDYAMTSAFFMAYVEYTMSEKIFTNTYGVDAVRCGIMVDKYMKLSNPENYEEPSAKGWKFVMKKK